MLERFDDSDEFPPLPPDVEREDGEGEASAVEFTTHPSEKGILTNFFLTEVRDAVPMVVLTLLVH